MLMCGCDCMIDTTTFCSPGLCQHYGICHEGDRSFRCDCNMTSFVGTTCTDGMASLFTDNFYLFARYFCIGRSGQETDDAAVQFL